VSTGDGSLEIVIRDTGIGIPEDQIADLRQPFKRIENVLSSRYPGSDMGLFITKALVERHGGTLEIESVPGGEPPSVSGCRSHQSTKFRRVVRQGRWSSARMRQRAGGVRSGGL
jgi:signal transduction histidine kinase